RHEDDAGRGGRGGGADAHPGGDGPDVADEPGSGRGGDRAQRRGSGGAAGDAGDGGRAGRGGGGAPPGGAEPRRGAGGLPDRHARRAAGGVDGGRPGARGHAGGGARGGRRSGGRGAPHPRRGGPARRGRGDLAGTGVRLVYGVNPVRELIRSRPRDVAVVYVADAAVAKELIALARDRAIALEERTRRELDALAGPDARHQGVVAIAGEYAYREI